MKPRIYRLTNTAQDVWCPKARYAWCVRTANGIGFFGDTIREAWVRYQQFVFARSDGRASEQDYRGPAPC